MSRLFDLFGQTFKQGEIIFREGDAADALYMIHRGRVQISKRTIFADESINILGEREFFGEMALVSSEPRNATAIALDDCDLIRMERENFEQAMKENINLAISVLRMLTRRLRDADDLMTGLMEKEKKHVVLDEIMTSMMQKGVRDATRIWILYPLDTFVQECSARLSVDNDVILRVVQSLKDDSRIYIKKNSDGKRLLALPMQAD